MRPPVLVDTSVVSWYLRRDARAQYPHLVEWLDAVIAEDGLHISSVSLYELRRGIGELRARGQGARKAARVELLLREATVVGLDAGDHLGWKIAADLWVKCRTHKPAIVLSEGDLLITATALAHNRALVTVDENLRSRLKQLGLHGSVCEIAVA
jgi:predicted nucleic acid-binding protein